jgi:hypothetical protein
MFFGGERIAPDSRLAHSRLARAQRLRVCAKSVFLRRQLPARPLKAFFISFSR